MVQWENHGCTVSLGLISLGGTASEVNMVCISLSSMGSGAQDLSESVQISIFSPSW